MAARATIIPEMKFEATLELLSATASFTDSNFIYIYKFFYVFSQLFCFSKYFSITNNFYLY